jgi:hypothetical protein
MHSSRGVLPCVCMYVCDQETPQRDAKDPSWTVSACERINIRNGILFPDGGVGLVPKRGCLLTLSYYAFPRWYEFGERRWNDILTGETRGTREKPAPVSLCPPQIPHGLTRARTRASPMKGRRLTTWAMARPNGIINLIPIISLSTCPFFYCLVSTTYSRSVSVNKRMASELPYSHPSQIILTKSPFTIS